MEFGIESGRGSVEERLEGAGTVEFATVREPDRRLRRCPIGR